MGNQKSIQIHIEYIYIYILKFREIFVSECDKIEENMFEEEIRKWI